MNPDQLQAVAAQAYVEMLEAGFGRVGEFHYLHHDPSGTLTPIAVRCRGESPPPRRRAASGFALLPVFYAHSTFGGAAPTQAQRRFINTLESYELLLERSRSRPLAFLQPSLASPHSLRAVTPKS